MQHPLLSAVSCVQIIKRIPQLQKLDGIPIEGDERDAATAGAAATIAA